MKKLILLLVVAAAGFVAWKKYTESNSERDLWSEVTDTLD